MYNIIMDLERSDNFTCPYCGETNTLAVDNSAGSRQKFVVDCEICCAPIVVIVHLQIGEEIIIDVRRENE